MPDVAELLASVRRTYAAAASYSDSGRVVFSGGTLDGETAVFRTTFERRGRTLSLRYSARTGDISLVVDADHIEIMPPELHSLLRANILSNAIAVLTGVTSGVAHHVFSMLLPDEISGRALCAEDREYVLKETPSSGGGVWILTTAVEPRHELVIGQDLLLRAYRVRGSSRTRPTS